MDLDIGMRTVLRGLDAGGLLLEDEAPGASALGCYISFKYDRTPIRRDLFDRLRDAGLIEPVMSARLPQRWRATEDGKAALAALDERRLASRQG